MKSLLELGFKNLNKKVKKKRKENYLFFFDFRS